MKVLDLFSGIGGFSLGLERAGMETVAFCEIEPYQRSILKKHWSDVPIYEDITQLTKEVLDNDGITTVDVICGGFPCQPFSIAGKRGGEEDSRYLWGEMFRLIQDTKPSWVIAENVSGLLTISEGMVFSNVLSDLETEGYDVQTFIIPACAVNAVHRRDRLWIVANLPADSQLHPDKSDRGQTGEKDRVSGISGQTGCAWFSGRTGSDSEIHGEGLSTNPISEGLEGDKRVRKHNGETQGRETGSSGSVTECSHGSNQVLSDSQCIGHRGRGIHRDSEMGERQGSQDKQENRDKVRGKTQHCSSSDNRREFRPIPVPTEPPVRHRDDGVSDRLARLKALGNAVVPQIPQMIGQAIMEVSHDR